MTYWKATRPNGTDFYTGTADYWEFITGRKLPGLRGPYLFDPADIDALGESA